MYGVKCWKMKQILLKYRQYVVLPPNWVPRGDLLSIAMHIISSIFKLLTVTHGQGLMSIKFNALFMCKQHPTQYCNQSTNQSWETFLTIAGDKAFRCLLHPLQASWAWCHLSLCKMCKMSISQDNNSFPLALTTQGRGGCIWEL